eukprot:TRINITY_DN641_c0_g1_i2.p1 TRINITY_DN641_c0_g1~~TRINITY_DN641_c0_g1_i2.p1  ORF type:complete len:102 (-),score=19.86 TRINITY_DN641_c0_g1_i2:279-584(-)
MDHQQNQVDIIIEERDEETKGLLEDHKSTKGNVDERRFENQLEEGQFSHVVETEVAQKAHEELIRGARRRARLFYCTASCVLCSIIGGAVVAFLVYFKVIQ